jgi:hypothetical protein
MSLPCRSTCGPAQVSPIWEPCTPHTTTHSPPTILHCATQGSVTPAMVVCDHGVVVGWRLQKSCWPSTDEKRRLKRVYAPSHCHGPSSSATHPRCHPSITRYKDCTHGSWHLILTKARILANYT